MYVLEYRSPLHVNYCYLQCWVSMWNEQLRTENTSHSVFVNCELYGSNYWLIEVKPCSISIGVAAVSHIDLEKEVAPAVQKAKFSVAWLKALLRLGCGTIIGEAYFQAKSTHRLNNYVLLLSTVLMLYNSGKHQRYFWFSDLINKLFLSSCISGWISFLAHYNIIKLFQVYPSKFVTVICVWCF